MYSLKMRNYMEKLELLYPQWPAPARVRALSTTRKGGVSGTPWHGLNLGDHVGDSINAVTRNRIVLSEAARLPGEPVWLQQVHGCIVTDAREGNRGCEADAALADEPGQVCAVLTADCLPVLLCDQDANQVAAVHAGWRGLASGIVESTLQRFDARNGDIMAWLGPAIGARAFEVGVDVRDAFVSSDNAAAQAFRQKDDEHWLCDLYMLARQKLAGQGVTGIYGGGYCTYTDKNRFFSYRRDGQTGRMASMIWLES